MLGLLAQQEPGAHGKKREALEAPKETIHARAGIGRDQRLREEPT